LQKFTDKFQHTFAQLPRALQEEGKLQAILQRARLGFLAVLVCGVLWASYLESTTMLAFLAYGATYESLFICLAVLGEMVGLFNGELML